MSDKIYDENVKKFFEFETLFKSWWNTELHDFRSIELKGNQFWKLSNFKS